MLTGRGTVSMALNIADICDALSVAYPGRECLTFRDRRLTWADVADRTNHLAAIFGAAGLGRTRPFAGADGWESTQDHVALYLHNGNEYLEAMLGSFKARAAPFNVNYRYVAEELAYVLNDARAGAVVYHGCFASTLAEVLPSLKRPPLLLRVDDGSGDELLPGALDFEAALATSSPQRPDVDWRPDDLYVLYTGGTTGSPKGVLWRQADFLVGALGVGGRDGEVASVDELVEAAIGRHLIALPAPPFMHGAAHWNALSCWLGGGTVVVQSVTDRLDAADVLDTVQRHGVTSLLLVGDAFARPLIDEQARAPRDLSTLRFVLTGGAVLSPAVQAELLEVAPGVRVVDVLGSSESGRQAVARVATDTSGAGRFVPSGNATVLDGTLSRRLDPGDGETGWLAQSGRIPRGYLGDRPKTERTFPTIDGVRYAVPGDRARWRADGTIELAGRDSVTINTGGEKVFAEEVEQALKHHPDLYDVLVVGRPSARWGQEVVAVAVARPGSTLTLESLREVAGAHIARYKLPKALVLRDQVERSPSGKPDYGWARAQATGA